MLKNRPIRSVVRPAFSLLVGVALVLAWIPRAECGVTLVAEATRPGNEKTAGCCAKHAQDEKHDEKAPSKRSCAGCVAACCGAAVATVSPATALKTSDNSTLHHLTDETAYHGSITHSIFHPPKSA